VVAFGITANEVFMSSLPKFVIGTEHLVNIPLSESFAELKGNLSMPDFNMITDQTIWVTAVTIAIVASIETLLCIEAVDKIDTYKRITPKSRELVAQGVGNIASGMIGGLPVTSVIVRSSANAQAGARTGMSAILHGVILLTSVLFIPKLLNLIPLSALAAILINVGYKLTDPSLYVMKYRHGWAKFVPFVVTVLAILFTDLLIGIGIGLVVGIFFVLLENYYSAILLVKDGDNYLIRAKKDLFFMHKYELRKTFSAVPDDAQVLIDLSRLTFIDLDNVEVINDFIENAKHRNIRITIKRKPEVKATNMIEEPKNETV
jgi:carbonic anhydrase